MVTEIKKERIKLKIDVHVNIVKEYTQLSTSSRMKVACILVKKDFTKIAAFGYNGNYSNAPINPLTGTEEESLEPGKDGYLHAELNASLKFRENDPENYIVLVSHSPCANCAKLLANSGFKYIYWISDYREKEHLSEIFTRCNILGGNIDQLKTDYLNEKI